MRSPFFSHKDFQLCDVPVPKGYPQSQTHCSIALYENKYYLTTSPFPGVKHSSFVLSIRSILKRITKGVLCNPKSGEFYENPCLYYGLSTNNSAPTNFVALSDRPLMGTPEQVYGLPAYNSDPELYLEKGRVFILNRSVFRTKLLKRGYESVTCIYLIEGIVKYERFKMESIRLVKEWEKAYVSPCLTKFRDRYIFTYLDTNSALDSMTFNGLYLQELGSIEELSDNNYYKKVTVHSKDMLPWHMSLFSYGNVLYTIIACVQKNDKTRKIWQMLGEFSNDLSELIIYPTPLTDFNSYRGGAIVRDDGQFVLYSTVVWESIRGAKSVDGRDVILAQCSFKKLLEKVQ